MNTAAKVSIAMPVAVIGMGLPAAPSLLYALFVVILAIVVGLSIFFPFDGSFRSKPSIGHNEQIMRNKIAAAGLDARRSAIAEPILIRMRELEQRHGLFAGDEQVKSRMRLIDKIIESQIADNAIAAVNDSDLINAEINGFVADPKDIEPARVENKYPDDPGAVFNASVDKEQADYLKALADKKAAFARVKELAEIDSEPVVAPTTIVQSDAQVARRNARIEAIQGGRVLPRDPRSSLKPNVQVEFEICGWCGYIGHASLDCQDYVD